MVLPQQQEIRVDGAPDNRSEPAAPADRAWAMPEHGGSSPIFTVPAGGAAPEEQGATLLDRGSHDRGDSGPRESQRWEDDRSPRHAGATAALGPPPLPVPLEPMTVSDLLDGAWGILKSRPRTVLSVTAIIIVPIELVSAALQHNLSRGVDLTSLFVNQPSGSGRSSTFSAGLFGLAYLASALSALSYFFLGGALARLVSAWYAGGDLTVKQAVMASLRKTHIYLGAFPLLLIAKGIGLAMCYLGLIAVIPLFMLTAPAIMIEDLGPIAGPMRSARLVQRRFWWCVWVWFLAFIIEATVNAMLSAIPGSLATLNLPLTADFLVPAFSAFSKLVTAPFVVGVCVLMYLDLRVRTEGLDLELEASHAFAQAS
jgi:hypothetical protein